MKGTATLANDISVTATVRATAALVGHADATFHLKQGTFQTRVIPEGDNLWGPLTLPKLPDGVMNQCTMATHT